MSNKAKIVNERYTELGYISYATQEAMDRDFSEFDEEDYYE